VKNVYCTTSNYFFAEHQRHDVEDFASLLLRFESDIDASITVGRTGWMSHPGSGLHQVRLVGSKGTEIVDAFRPRLEIYSEAAGWRPPAVPSPEDPMGFWSSTQATAGVQPKRAWQPVEPAATSDTSYFLDCLDAGRESDVSAFMGAHAVEILLAGYESAARGQMVSILV
jgi:predicted dehydrogenase